MAPNKKRWKETSAEYIGTFVYLDEPQVVLLDHGDDTKIIGVAIEKEGFEYPFLGAEVSFDQLQRYKRQFVDLRYLFLRPRWKKWYIFDLAAADENRKIPLIKAEQEDYENPDYLPSHGFFAKNHTEHEEEMDTAGITTQTFHIDGTWDPPDLSLFFGRINDLYSFFLGVRKFITDQATFVQKRALVKAFTENSLHSGFNYVNLYGDLKGLLNFEERLAMRSIVKQSPGHVDIEGRKEILDEVTAAFETFTENFEELKEQYNVLHGYLSKMGLLKTDGHKRFDKAGPVARFIREKNSEFATLLGLDGPTMAKLTGRNDLLTAKLLLSHYRRLSRYQLFFVEGRVQSDDVEDDDLV